MEEFGTAFRIPDFWQAEAVAHMKAGRDVVLHAPTGTGKTFVFELFFSQYGGRATYTVPTRALANDKYAQWKSKNWRVGISTGDRLENPDAAPDGSPHFPYAGDPFGLYDTESHIRW